MSMNGNFFMTDEKTIERIQNEILSVETLAYDDENENEDIDNKTLDIGGLWDVIHFTLTEEMSETNILTKIIHSGAPVNNVDDGYGPAMLITKQEVRDISKIINKITEEEFSEKFDVAAMVDNDIYIAGSIEDEDEFFENTYSEFKAIQEFFSEAVKQNYCILFFIN